MTDEKTPTQDELMDSLVSKIEARMGDQLDARVEAKLEGVLNKNRELLGKLADSKLDAAELRSQIETFTAAADTSAPKPKETPADTRDIILSRADARDPRAYQRAKAEAAKRGVEVRFEGRNDAA
jgi:hypothetical protein